MRSFALLSLALALSCKGDGADEPASCDVAAEHLIDVCNPYVGEDFRAICEIEDDPFVTPHGRSCVARLGACNEAMLDACDVHHITSSCDEDSDCLVPFKCDVDHQECVRCLADEDCAAGRACLMGLCFDSDSEFYQSFSMFFAQDAGTPAMSQ